MELLPLLTFAAVYLAAVASPGPGMAMVVARGLAMGRAGAVPFIAGFVAGDLILFTISATGLAVIARSFETLFLVIKLAGCGWLLYMAWKIWRAPAVVADVAATGVGARAWPSFLSSLSLTLGNPKAIVFFVSILPLVVDLKELTLLVYLEVAAVMVLVFTPVLALALYSAAQARRWLRSGRAVRRVNRCTAGVMAGAAVVLATR
jgi:threonine/homoserine/homoserine lactone efflux protein